MAGSAFVFPGQGSQSVGMLGDLYRAFPIVRQTYEEAADVLGFDLWQLSSEGSAESLNQTVNTQPAMLVAGIACFRVFQEKSALMATFFAGHSLGEYTALLAAGQIGFAEALALARRRAEAMQAAVPQGSGAMAAILGLDLSTIQSVCRDISKQHNAVWAANDNAPGQVVIAGHRQALTVACEALKSAGAKHAIVLPVSVPSHCPLMQAAADKMQAAFATIDWQPGTAPVVHNVNASAHHGSATAIADALTEQLVKPVRWTETVRFFAQKGIDHVIEFGPGKVLMGLNKRIDKTMAAYAVFDQASLDETFSYLSSKGEKHA